MDFIPYKINEYLENVFYQIPKELFKNPYYKNISAESKLLYALLLDRLSISMQNKWVDEDGNIFLIFSRREAVKQLTDCKLIYEKRQGFKKNNIIYVGKINHEPTSKFMTRKNYDSRNGNFTNQESEKLRPNNNKYNKNNYSNVSQPRKNFSNFEQRVYAPGELDKLYCNFENLKEGE